MVVPSGYASSVRIGASSCISAFRCSRAKYASNSVSACWSSGTAFLPCISSIIRSDNASTPPSTSFNTSDDK